MTSAPASAAPPRPVPTRWRQMAPWAALVALLVVLQAVLIWLTVRYERTRIQEQVDQVAVALSADVTQFVMQDVRRMQALLWNDVGLAQWRADAADLLRQRPELLRLERRSAQGFTLIEALDTPFGATVHAVTRREAVIQDAELACVAARRLNGPMLSRSYFVPGPGGMGTEVAEICVPVEASASAASVGGYMIGTVSLTAALEGAASKELRHRHEVSLLESDGARLARAGLVRGAGVFVSHRVVDLPGLSLTLQVDSAAQSPGLIPNLATALVLGLSLALFGVVVLLWRDVRRRSSVERQLAESLAFRQAMEDSLVTGLRARDLDGRITYVNPAFCRMVGFAREDLLGRSEPPYWPPDRVDAYRERHVRRVADGGPPREGYETIFMRRTGERFPVVIYEAPLVDADGRQTGWMSTALDLSDQRRAEELSRQQAEKLQATARLATVGEMASLLSHELNQPLSAIASYATGSLNLIDENAGSAESLTMVRQAVARIAEQAQRAGRVIKSVHDFVRRRDHAHETVRVDDLFDTVLPLVRLLARKSSVTIEIDLPRPAPHVRCDRTMVEQVLLNLTRNAIQSMDQPEIPAERRILTLAAGAATDGTARVVFEVRDHGTGIAPEVAAKLFTPFFSTRSEGMGLGLSLCRTVIEQHGGTLQFEPVPDDAGQVTGTVFRFTLAKP